MAPNTRRIDYRFINPFITSAVYIIRQTTDLHVKRKNLYLSQGKASIGGLQIILEINGEIEGKIVYELSRGVTVRIATRMIEKSTIKINKPEEFKQILESAILELTNLITGRAITLLSKYGYNCSITPPILYFGGKNTILIQESFQVIVIEMTTIFGDFKINLSLSEVSPKIK